MESNSKLIHIFRRKWNSFDLTLNEITPKLFRQNPIFWVMLNVNVRGGVAVGANERMVRVAGHPSCYQPGSSSWCSETSSPLPPSTAPGSLSSDLFRSLPPLLLTLSFDLLSPSILSISICKIEWSREHPNGYRIKFSMMFGHTCEICVKSDAHFVRPNLNAN